MANRTPPGLKTAGKALWLSIAGEDAYELEVHEELVLREACRCADQLDDINAGLRGAPLTVRNSRGDEVAHPLLGEARQQRIVLTRLIASLRLPSGEEDARPQRRGSARGAYQPRSEPRSIHAYRAGRSA